MLKPIFAVAISGILLCTFSFDPVRAQTTTQQDAKDKKAGAAEAAGTAAADEEEGAALQA